VVKLSISRSPGTEKYTDKNWRGGVGALNLATGGLP
jgi:hypothetical protein